jgi:hypothetical protein
MNEFAVIPVPQSSAGARPPCSIRPRFLKEVSENAARHQNEIVPIHGRNHFAIAETLCPSGRLQYGARDTGLQNRLVVRAEDLGFYRWLVNALLSGIGDAAFNQGKPSATGSLPRKSQNLL